MSNSFASVMDIQQRSPTFLAPGTGLLKTIFPRMGEGNGSGSNASYVGDSSDGNVREIGSNGER